MLKFQNYKHYKLPITMNPLEYGKLIIKIDNVIVSQINRTNIALITQFDDLNNIKIFKEGDFLFEYSDHRINDNNFIRSLFNKKFSFENNELVKITTDKVLNAVFALVILIIFFKLLNETSFNLVVVGLTTTKNIIKLRKVSAKYKWKEEILNFNNKIFTKILFSKIFKEFWLKIEENFTENNHMFILVKIKYINSDFSSIGKVQRINKSDLNWYIDFIIENMKFKSEYYNETPIDQIIISYGFKDGKIKNKENLILNTSIQKYKNYNIPISMNPMDFGRVIIQNKFELSINYILQYKNGITININKFDKYNLVEFFKSGISLIKFKDIFINKNEFIREIDNKSFVFKNGEQILFESKMKCKFITKTKKQNNLVNNFITLDIETYIHNNTLIPFLICMYDGQKSTTFALWNYKNVENMILDCLNSIFIRKYNGYKVYIHNMAKFDIIFLLKYLVKIASVQPIIHNGRIISLIINYGKDLEYQIDFRDSYLILLNSLLKLSKAFNVENEKTIFPYFFVNKDNLNYKGKVPDIKYFNKIDELEYNIYRKKFIGITWNLRKEAIDYCINDCVSLYQIIYKFNNMIFKLFSINIHKYPTLPSLAFAIFRSNFMKEENIPQLIGKIANDIRSGYTGGSCDVFIHKSKTGVKIKGYDVNALYPSQMKTKPMPIGNYTYFEGDISKLNPDAFGFFYVEIKAPNNIKHPILQTHVKTSAGIRTISPIGTWEDMIFSSEMYNAQKLGYTFNILWGYTFESDYIFEGYVTFLHNIRNQYSRSNPMNFLAKILLNSLYGRFGMDDNFDNINVIHKNYYPDFENKYLDFITDKIELGDYWIVFYKGEETNENIVTHNVSIGIAAAITAYSRIHMSYFKNNPKINLYYTDTDSIYTDSDIDESLIDDKILGKLKLEHICDKAIFLTPKVYCLVTENGVTIYKVKGLTHEVKLNYEDFDNLLNKNVLIEKTQTKWFKKLSDAKIDLLNEVYTLKLNENKRELIYKNNKVVSSKAYKIDKNKFIL